MLLCITGSLVYEGCFSLELRTRFAPHVNLGGGRYPAFPQLQGLKLTDNHDNEYSLMQSGGFGGGSDDSWSHGYLVQPLLDETASQLKLELAAINFMPGMRNRNTEAMSLTGPWTVELAM
jgi:hypothetical protein